MNRTRKRRCKQNKWSTLFIQWLAVIYLLFFIGFELTSPTTAHFQDKKEVTGSIRAAPTFDSNQQESDKPSKSEQNEKQSGKKDQQPDGSHKENAKEQNSHIQQHHKAKDKLDLNRKHDNQQPGESQGQKGAETKATDSQTIKSEMPETSSKADNVKAEKARNGEQKK